MKTISGVVVTSKPVSLTKAAKILPKFAFADNGASPAFVTYLKRTSDSFEELAQLRKELRGSDSGRKIKKHRSRNHDSRRSERRSKASRGMKGKTKRRELL